MGLYIDPKQTYFKDVFNDDGDCIQDNGKWYGNILNSFCGIGLMRVRDLLDKAASEGKTFAEAYKLVLDIGFYGWNGYYLSHLSLDEDEYGCEEVGREYQFELGHIHYAEIQRKIFQLVKLSIKEGYKIGVLEEKFLRKVGINDRDGLLYVEFDGFAFAEFWDISPYLEDWTSNYFYDAESLKLPPLRFEETQEVTVGDILPSLEEQLLKKFEDWGYDLK